MGQKLRKLDIIALTASGEAAKKLTTHLQNQKADIVSAIAGDTIYHQGILDLDTVVADDASDLATALTLANELKTKMNVHLPSTGTEGVHRAASAETIAAATATNLATAITLANELKADYNTHLSESGVHIKDDATNDVTAADASDQATLETLLNEIKADYNAHVIVSISMGFIES